MEKPKIKDVAKELGVTSSYISAVLKGKKPCSLSMANKLSKYYQLAFKEQTKVLRTFRVVRWDKND